ncbi:hypothetical protein GCM10029964_018860 [Kibdelosporangium lantanae]
MADAADTLDRHEVAGAGLECRSALNAVMPPHIIGDASSNDNASGIRATASCGATMYSA